MATTSLAAVASVADTQHGVITRPQLRTAGLSDSAIDRLVRDGFLHRVHRGVFRVGHQAPSEKATWMAAVLAHGEGTLLDLADAARLYGLNRISRRRRRGPIAVLTPRQVAPVQGVRARRTRHLPAAHCAVVDGIPVVSIERLLVNLARVESVETMCKLLDEVAYDELLHIARLRRTMEQLRHCGSYAVMSSALERYEDGERGTDSELEAAALELVREAGVRDPELNRVVRAGDEEYRADQLWRDKMVVQEVDGIGHRRPTRRRQDQRRRAALRAEGFTVLVLVREDLRDPRRRRAAIRRLQEAVGFDPAPLC